jgi:hypothetical protein
VAGPKISVIVTQPQAAAVTYGRTASFTATVAKGQKLTYQWLKDGVPLVNSKRIIGANALTLSILGITTADAGAYALQISGPIGLTTTVPVSLTVLGAPTFLQQPGPTLSVNVGGTFTLHTSASGLAPLRYQWFKGGVALKNAGVHLQGAFTAKLAVRNAVSGDTGTYTVQVSNAVTTVTSGAAVVTVTPAK